MVHRRWCVAVWFLVMLLGVVGVGQNLSFEWDANLHILPDVEMDYIEFEIDYTYQNWQFMTDIKYFDMQFIDLSFQVDGSYGPLDFDGGVVFDPLFGEGYDGSYFEVKTSNGFSSNFDLAFKVENYAEWTLNSQTGSYTLSTIKGGYDFYDPISLSSTLRFHNFRCGGSNFKDVTIAVTGFGFGFICDQALFGIALSLNCEGFDSISVSGKDIVAIADFMEFDISFTYGLDYKSFTLTPELILTTFCGNVELYQRMITDPNHPLRILGVSVYGIKCVVYIGTCTKVEFGTAFGASSIPGGLEDDEFEYIKASFCRPGCCGAKITGGFGVYFKPVAVPIGISRVTAYAEIPVSVGFSMMISFESPGTLDIGWELSF